MATFTPYITGAPFFGQKPSWIPNELDQQRIQSYQVYEEIYWNVPDTFKVSLRGTNDLPIYIPNGRIIVDTTNRYVAPGFTVGIAHNGPETPALVAQRDVLRDFMRREGVRSKFNGNKRYGLIRGDWIWHVTADPAKPEGTRISVTALDPGMYFPITDEDDVDKILGCHLVEQIMTDEGPRIRRQTYRKVPRADGSNQITVEDAIFEVDAWGGPTDKPVKVLRQPEPLPDPINQLPVYHIKNFEEPGNPFGSSEMRGLEALMGRVNQVISDEDLALALEGLGMYATDAPHPVDPATGRRIPWQIGPGRVIHTPEGHKWNRVDGISTVLPFGDHYDRLMNALKQASSTPDVAIGTVDVQVAQSGIALAIQLGPMLAKAGEKNDTIIDVHTQMFFDLMRGWYAAYEGGPFDEATPEINVSDPIPVDRERRFAELKQMKEDGVIDGEYYRDELRKIGYTFPEDIAARIQAEQDAFAARAGQELTSDGAE